MQDPYEVLGVPRDAGMDEIKKAYRTLSRKYHPDANINNPDKEAAEEQFKRVQQAYDQIVEERERGTSAGYGDGGFGTFGGFGNYGGYGGYGFGGTTAQEDPKLQAAANYINSRHYQEAMHVLGDIPEHTAAWYYYHALANAGLGNNINAAEDAQQAASMEPNNLRYQQLYSQLSGAGGWYRDMGRGYGYDDCQTGTGGAGLCTACAACTLMNLCCCGPYGGVLCC